MINNESETEIKSDTEIEPKTENNEKEVILEVSMSDE